MCDFALVGDINLIFYLTPFQSYRGVLVKFLHSSGGTCLYNARAQQYLSIVIDHIGSIAGD